MAETDFQREKIYLAALLHDIGKFYQRADTGSVKSSKFLEETVKNNIDFFCKQKPYGYSHVHVLWTAQFFQDFKNIFRNVIPKGNEVNHDTGLDTITQLSASHHNPGNSILQYIIQKADHLSSGADRTAERAEKDFEDENKWDSFKKKRMVSIFESLHKESDYGDYNYRIPVKAVELSKGYFPIEKSTNYPEYDKLWGEFISDFNNIQSDNLVCFSETFLELLRKYTSNIPSSTMHLRDVSLFDHLKTTAAFAIALYDYINAKNKLSKFDIAPGESPFLMIGGDLSGIQSFIYDIVSKNAAKNLKGRSFYLQVLADSIIQTILNELKLYQANIIYASGGGFYLLAPNTTTTVEKIKELEVSISNKVFDAHNTSIYFALDYTSISFPDIFDHKIGDNWKGLIEKLNRKKRQRYHNKLIDQYGSFFTQIKPSEKQLRDNITGEDIYNEEDVKKVDNLTLKFSTYEQIELGKNLKNTKFWITSSDAVTYWEKEKIHGYNACNFGIYHYFISEKQLERSKELLKGSGDRIKIKSINETNFVQQGVIGKNNIYGFDFYGGNDFPSFDYDTEIDNVIYRKDEPKTFDLLAGEGDFKRLGVLRMDVDNLGQIFINGIDKERRTFSRYSTLSRNLDFFFKGYINTIWKKKPYNENSYILYSGGDDLFIIGRWDILIQLAEEIRKDFKEFTVNNKNLTISGGIAILPPKFPIMKGAEEAGRAEHIAKTYSVKLNDNNLVEKNAFTLLGMALGWENEFQKVKKLKEKLVSFLSSEQLPKALNSNIYRFYELRTHQFSKNLNESWRWQMAYQFTRMANRLRNEEAMNILHQIKTDAFANTWKGTPVAKNYHSLELIFLAARWAELELRTNKK